MVVKVAFWLLDVGERHEYFPPFIGRTQSGLRAARVLSAVYRQDSEPKGSFLLLLAPFSHFFLVFSSSSSKIFLLADAAALT